MNKDKIFASTLYQTAKVITIETNYDNKFNRPEMVEIVKEFPCRVARTSKAFPIITSSNTAINPQLRAYFEIDADIKEGSVIHVEDMKYIVGFIYKPMNHHIECDVSISMEA